MCDKAPYEAEFIIKTLARVTGDRSLERLARKYFRNVSYEDLELADNPEPGEEPGEDAIRALKGRSEMLKQFLSVAQEKMGLSLPTRE